VIDRKEIYDVVMSHTENSNISYERWSELIANHFFTQENADRIVFFAIDARLLSDISGLSEADAVDSLVHSVKEKIDDWRVFRLTNLTKIWEQRTVKEEPPPAVAFLAFTVLAATKMGENQKFSTANFYVPLRQLLDPDDLGTGAPGSFAEHIKDLWESVRTWLRDAHNGSRGLLPPRPDTHFVNIIEALQFAVVRAAHFRKLEEFFRRIGLEPGEEIVGADLIENLKSYLRTRHADWAGRLLRFCEEHPDVAASMVVEEAKKWDGMPRDARTGKAIGRLVLGFDSLRNSSLFILASWDDRLPQQSSIVINGESHSLTAIHDSDSKIGWFEPLPLDINVSIDELVTTGFETDRGSEQFEFQEREVYAFAFDELASCWTSVSSMLLEVPHHMMVKDEHLLEAKAFFDSTSAVSPAKITSLGSNWPKGWSLLTGVRLDVRPIEKVPDFLRSLIPSGSGPRLRARDGLKVGIVRYCYLTGGAPIIELNSLESEEPLEITALDSFDVAIGQPFVIDTRQHPSGQVPLANIGYLFNPGIYSIRQGGSSLRVQFVDGLTEIGGDGMSSVSTQLSQTSSASGTKVNNAPNNKKPIMVTAPQPASEFALVLLIGRDMSECVEIRIPKLPALANLSWTKIDAWCNFAPQWCIDASKKWAITPLAEEIIPPATSIAPISSTWKVAVRKGNVESLHNERFRAAWREYVELLGAESA
jgi:hypothetical protein